MLKILEIVANCMIGVLAVSVIVALIIALIYVLFNYFLETVAGTVLLVAMIPVFIALHEIGKGIREKLKM
jgi:hypothetical protein